MDIKYYELQDFYSILYLYNDRKYIKDTKKTKDTSKNKNHNNENKNNTITIQIPENIYNFWFRHKDYWFCHSFIHDWNMVKQIYQNTIPQLLSLILQYDQLFRHPSNYQEKIDNNKQIAFRFATHLSFQILHSDYYKILTNEEKIFVLLTIRHNHNLNLKYFVLRKIYQELKENETDKLWLRFLNATILDIDTYKKKQGYQKERILNNYQEYIHSFQDIIERSDITITTLQDIKHNNNKNNIKNNIKNKKNNRNNNKISFEENIRMKYNELFYTLEEEMSIKIKDNKNNKLKKIAVSISGGVDSMVASFILNLLCKERNIELILLHICYNNRESCFKEKNLLKYWAKLLNCELFIRDIDEIQRSRHSLLRNAYETITRNIRFSFYEYFNCPIVLGHNRDDTFENIFSNLSKQIHFDNLFGMKEISIENNIIILRPLLSCNKKNILSYAITQGIPYLQDSTPKWSKRGKTRDILIPHINDFDTNILVGLEEYVKYTKFLEEQWQHSFKKWVSNSVHYKKSLNSNQENEYHISNQETKQTLKQETKPLIEINRDTFFETNYTHISFWIKIWFELNLDTRPSNKSILNLIQTIKKNKYIHCDLNKKYKMYIQKHIITVLMD